MKILQRLNQKINTSSNHNALNNSKLSTILMGSPCKPDDCNKYKNIDAASIASMLQDTIVKLKKRGNKRLKPIDNSTLMKFKQQLP